MRALVATLGSLGDLHPFLALAGKLKQRGHEVVVAAPERYRDLTRSDGLQHHALRPETHPERYKTSGTLEPGRGFPTDLEFYLRHLGDTFDDLLSLSEGADVLVAAPLIIPSLLIAAERRIPWVECVYALPASLMTALPEDLQYLGTLPGNGGGEARFLKRAAAALAALCRDRGIARSALRKRPDQRLYLFPEWFVGSPPDWPSEGDAVVGFCFREGSTDVLPSQLQEFLSDGKRPIVLTLGSTAVHAVGPDFYEMAALAMRRLGCAAIFLAGPHRVELRSGMTSEAGIIAAAYAPIRLLFPKASVVVHHGGMGTIAEALRAGVPQLVIPFSFDQPYNAAWASRLGVAKVLTPRLCGTEALERTIAPLLHEPAYTDEARRLARRMRGHDGAEAACERIEATVEG